MDIRDAIRRHLEWKVALEWMLCGQQPVNPAQLAQPDQCALGHWLTGEATALYGGTPALAQAIEAHERFHDICGQVAVHLQAGEREAAADLLQAGGVFTQASREIIGALDDLARLADRAGK
ncbi:MAG: CZB domain-containing protein [Rhodocyclaceae bacterium]|nr:CZB domain-containing protein [Rhodocyclaceae bacterium]